MEDEMQRMQRDIKQLQHDLYGVQRIFMPLIRFNEAVERIEHLIEEEKYEEAKIDIDTLDKFLGPLEELVGLRTHIDMIEFLEDQEDDEDLPLDTDQDF